MYSFKISTCSLSPTALYVRLVRLCDIRDIRGDGVMERERNRIIIRNKDKLKIFIGKIGSINKDIDIDKNINRSLGLGLKFRPKYFKEL